MATIFVQTSKPAVLRSKAFSSNFRFNYLLAGLLVMALSFGHCFAQTMDTAVANTNNNSATADSLNNKPAMFPGGNHAFTSHLIRNLRIPENYGPKIAVTIAVTFTVEASGKLKDFLPSDGPKELQKEAVRVIKAGGDWLPAYQDGKAVSSQKTQNIRFMLE